MLKKGFLNWVGYWTISSSEIGWFHGRSRPFIIGTSSVTVYFGTNKEERKVFLKMLLGTQECEFTQLLRHYPLIPAGWCGRCTQKYTCVSNATAPIVHK